MPWLGSADSASGSPRSRSAARPGANRNLSSVPPYVCIRTNAGSVEEGQLAAEVAHVGLATDVGLRPDVWL